MEPVLYPVFAEKQLRVFIKRDDLIHPYISGNKWRKLKYTLRRAEQEQKRHLVTFGGAWSNHLVATACAAAKFGFKSTGFVRGEEIQNLALTLCRIFGMQLIFTSRESYRDKQALFNQHFGNDSQGFFIDEGGAGPDAVKGCAELADELATDFDHVFCACGTGTTAAGLWNGLHLRGRSHTLHLVPVLKEGERLPGTIQHQLTGKFDGHIHPGYHFGGYAKCPPSLAAFIMDFGAATGILLDPVYTGKLVYAVADMAVKNQFKPHQKLLIIHSGGLTGIAGKLNDFSFNLIS
ncbi:1-aminocyclopropane-1-carboxylate deaminase/D-cysteine desulfhydrase [Hufsiella ginkgonis]|uniref:1-aminocyclopropane-1-carboxylate deaminase/D-cysteine desulfhydrase n=1 Tax=Hufsiella ginkgonis TaxID=2695274 RepID=UPI0034E1B83D